MIWTAKRVIGIVILLGTATSYADPPMDADARGRIHFELGRGQYRLGNYTQAIAEFSAGYDVSPKPQFLLNLGQCYRMLHQPEKAKEMFEKFLSESSPDDPHRDQIKKLLATLQDGPPGERPSPRRLETTEVPSTGTKREAQPDVLNATAARTEGVSKPSDNAEKQMDTPPQKTSRKKYWWLVAVGGAVVAGVAIGLAVALTIPNNASYPAGTQLVHFPQ